MCRLLEVGQTGHYDHYKQYYADILYKLGLLCQRAQVLKYVSYEDEPHKGIGQCTATVSTEMHAA